MKAIARCSICFAVFLFGAISINADAAPTRNGYWWLELNHLERIMFIQGYIDGLTRADKLVRTYIAIQTLKVKDDAQSDTVMSPLDFYRITYGQLGDGMDAFYGDFRNKRILFDYAMIYVRDQIRGISAAELDIRIENMRKATTNPDYDKQ
jgi:hypothetical protein